MLGPGELNDFFRIVDDAIKIVRSLSYPSLGLISKQGFDSDV